MQSLPSPDTASLFSREFRAEIATGMGGIETMYDPENTDAWIQSTVFVENEQ